jgi:hypothetical protein
MMETLLGGLVFAAYLFLQVAAVIAIQTGRQSQAYDAIRRDRGANVIWDSAN